MRKLRCSGIMLLATAAFLLVAVSSSAASYYVATNGTGSGASGDSF